MKTVEQLLEESRPAGQSHREVIKKYVRYGGLKRPNLLLFKHRIKLKIRTTKLNCFNVV